jgi:hypothetical protein
MKSRFYIEDYSNSHSYVVLRKTERGSETAATIGYNYGVSKRLVKNMARVCARVLNLFSKN